MNVFKCPKCGGELICDEKTLKCASGHSYDLSRSGYVNLLGGHSPSHGDDRQMLCDRRKFLETGAYSGLLGALIEEAEAGGLHGGKLLDAGCGEGWYTQKLFYALDPEYLAAIDVSKEAAELTAKRFEKSLRFSRLYTAAASVNALPFPNDSFDGVFSVFAPLAPEEFRRILKPNGLLIRAIPLENHLYNLKAAVYDAPYKNPSEDKELEGFELISRRESKSLLKLDGETTRLLFGMTPYAHKTSPHDLDRLNNITQIELQAEFAAVVYKKLT